MRIAELHLDAFGPFSGRRLDLGGSSEPGLCVIYGPNEAGKSSALRAIRGLLYGIPHQSEDDFVHRHQDLRIGARLCFRDGFSVELVRRKGTKQTLVGEGELGQHGVERLQALTRSVPETVFAHFHGLDHRGLVEGSRSLLEDGGELGRALFGAGLGIVHLRQLIEALEGEAQALFKPRGQNQRIATAVAAWKEIQAEIREKALEPSRFEEQATVVDGLAARLAALEGELEETHAELSRCRRLKEARQALARAEQEHREALARIARETEREAALVLSPRILAALEPIESLQRSLGAYLKSRDDLPRRKEELATLEREVASLSMRLGAGWDGAEESSLRRIVERAPRVRELVADAARFEDRLEKASELAHEAGAVVARLVREGSEGAGGDGRATPDPEPLGRILDRAKKLGPIDVQIDERLEQRAALERECARLQGQLALEGWSAARLEALALPSLALIERHARRHAESRDEGARLRERRRTLVVDRLAVGEELGRLREEGSLPSEAELGAERRERDQVWRSLRDHWLAPATSGGLETQQLLGARFETHLRNADQLADRLRNEAERVARGAALAAQALRLEAASSELEREEADHEAAHVALENAWQAIWPAALGEAGAPEARIEWRERFDALLALYARGHDLEALLERERNGRRAAVVAIREVLTPGEMAGRDEDERLEGWIERGELEHTRRTAERLRSREHAQARAQAEAQLERVVLGREQAAAQVEGWRARWRAELAVLSLPPETAPRDVEAHLDTIQRLLDRRSKLVDARSRVEKMRADAERFEAESRGLVARCLPEIAEFAADAAALRLKRELDSAREQATRADALRNALAEAREQLEGVERRLAACADELSSLAVRPPGNPAPTDGEVPAGPALMSFDGELDLDRLAARIHVLEERLERQGEERTAAFGDLRLQRAALEAMDGNAKQAELAERAEATRAQVLGDVRRYAELSLARQILEQEIEAYRRAHQGPLLAHTGLLFGELTQGAYPNVLSDAGDDGRARLVAVSRDARREVPVEGLSAGTRDQLFLALRLASLASTLENAEPMPLVADDILIEFDDERTRATLDVLARFGERTQILLFSHHRHVADFARALGDRARVVEL